MSKHSNKIIPFQSGSIVNSSSMQLFSNFKTCSVCLQQFTKLYSISRCHHQFCQLCCVSYIDQQSQSFSVVKCLEQSCDKYLDKELPIYQKISKKAKQRIQKLQNISFFRKNPYFKSCKSIQCDGYFNKNSSTPICNKCRQLHCNKCEQIAHKEKCQTNLIQSQLKLLNYKKCPQCKTWIQKIHGCTFIDCKCGVKFCYVCNQLYSNDRCRKIFHWKTNNKIKKQMEAISFWDSKINSNIFILILKLILKIILAILATPILCTFFMFFFLGLTFISLFLQSFIILVKKAQYLFGELTWLPKTLCILLTIIMLPLVLVFALMVQIFFAFKHFLFKRNQWSQYEASQSYDQLDKLVANSALYYLYFIGFIWKL